MEALLCRAEGDVSSAITRIFEAGKYESLNEAIEADVKDYFLRNYKEQVLKPELRDETITKGVEQAVRHAHDSYRRVIANGDMRLQLFLAKHTDHLEDIPAATPMTGVKLDWDAQKWKAPTYLMEDRAFDGIAGIGAAAAGGTVGALALGPAINSVLAQSFGQISRSVATSLGARITLAEGGAVAGTVVQPVGGQMVGAALGVLIGTAVDYLSNAANEAINRDTFIAANEEALDVDHHHLEVESGGQYRHGHRQMVRRRPHISRALVQVAKFPPIFWSHFRTFERYA